MASILLGVGASSSSLPSSLPSSREMQHRAVSLHFLEQFCLENDIRPECKNEKLETWQVVEHIIKPATSATRCNYAEHFLNSAQLIEPSQLPAGSHPTDHPTKMISTATHFLSHVWSYPFLVIIKVVREFVTELHEVQMKGLIEDSEVADQIDNESNVTFYFWLDIFAINQHTGVEQSDDLSHLEHAITVPERR